MSRKKDSIFNAVSNMLSRQNTHLFNHDGGVQPQAEAAAAGAAPKEALQVMGADVAEGGWLGS